MIAATLSVLELEFLQKVAALLKPMSIPEMFAGFAPKWCQDAADALVQLSLLVDETWDHANNAPRYSITLAGRAAITASQPAAKIHRTRPVTAHHMTPRGRV